MIPGLIQSKIDEGNAKYPWLFLTVFILFGVAFFLIEYKTKKLQMNLYALQILELQKRASLTSKNAVAEALKDDALVKTFNNFGV